MLAVAVAVFGALAVVAGLSLAAYLVWGPLAAVAAGLVVVGAVSLYAGLFLDLTPKKG